MSAKKHHGRFPQGVTRDIVTALVSRIRKGKTGYTYFQVRWYVGGARKAMSFSDLAEARKQAAILATRLHQGESRAPGTIPAPASASC
jgi:hypothetical protein